MSPTTKISLRAALVLAACLAGCVTASQTFTPLNPLPRDLKAHRPDQVEVFSSAPPQRPHVDVGLITVEEGLADQTPTELISALRQIAADLGCDALVLAPPGSKAGPDFFANPTSYKVYAGTCVAYR